MEEKPVSLMKSSLTYGIYLGIVSILLSVVLYVLGYTFEKWVQYTSYPIIIGGVIWAQIAYRKALGGEMTYGQALGVGTMTVIFSGVLSAIYIYLLYTVIDPSLIEQLRLATEQQLVEQGKVPEEQMDAVLDMMTKFQKPWIMSISAIFVGAIMGLIVSLITGIFTKKNPSDEVPA
jgi:magnesium-transporting ATPase (P-type)